MIGSPWTRLREAARWLASGAERRRRAIIAADFRASEAQLRSLGEGAPGGDPRKVAWLVSSFTTVWGYKMEGALSLALRLRGFTPRPVYLSSDIWARRYHDLFALRGGHDFRPDHRPETGLGRRAADRFLSGPRHVSELLSLDLNGIAVGRIALSNHLNRNKFTTLDLRDAQTAASIARDLAAMARNIEAGERLLSAERPAVVLFLEKGVSPMAELFGVCIREGVPVVQYAGAQKTDAYALKRFSRSNSRSHPFSLDPLTWEQVKVSPWSAPLDRAIMAELEDGYRSGTWFNRKFLHSGKSIKSAGEVRQQLGLNPSKKTAVIFSHVLWDATFFYGDGLFEDYETWLIETVRAACANPRLNWVIKLHPDLIWKLKYEGFTGELRDLLAIRAGAGPLPEHVKIVLPGTDISTFSFFGVTDYCVTVRGTIGIEMACHGVPVVTGGTGRYSGLGFTVDSHTAKQYLDRLAHLETLPPLDPRARELARRYAYAVFHGRPWHLRTFETIKAATDQVGHPLDHNLVPHVRTFGDLAVAHDMRTFAEWVDSDHIDYLETEEFDPACAAS